MSTAAIAEENWVGGVQLDGRAELLHSLRVSALPECSVTTRFGSLDFCSDRRRCHTIFNINHVGRIIQELPRRHKTYISSILRHTISQGKILQIRPYGRAG